MSSNPADDLEEALARTVEILHDHGVNDFAFTGGVAVGVWATPRQTRDLDVCGVLPAEEVNRLLALRDGIRSGPEQLPDMVRFRAGAWDVDLFVSKDTYDHECLSRAHHAVIGSLDLRVVSAEDLLIHKLIKLRTDRRRMLQDLADLRAVIQHRYDSLDWSYLQAWLPAHELQLLRSVADTDDEELVRRLLGS